MKNKTKTTTKLRREKWVEYDYNGYWTFLDHENSYIIDQIKKLTLV